ncbi:DUF1700 domain-containing protein [Companilactobacillus nodensis]|uniref:Integral membrane protein n=1 Tax=Companilactobacillus nodensis DSM 19682 = JCM 14932 = NBRC 107160 TaxID=1423775 RepID=A0A0R1KJM6_9LACO|nr:DUF1700 domain-containing protein [Companilactobacillus nodensis]KRK80170.1 hypothetical protein FD03_GL000051 [Companilactobacillus nodensis DSM 19682 = JCM 14932 = NBRC 107160]
METKAVESYINEFEVYLSQLDEDERKDVLEFYREFIIDANLDTSDKIINELGTPKHLARKVLTDYSIKMSEEDYQNVNDGNVPTEQKAKKNVRMIWLIILGLFATPVAIPVAIALILMLVLVVGMAVFGVLLFVFLVALSVILGVGSIFVGLSVMMQSLATTLFYVGAGFLILGVDFFLIPIIIAIFKWAFQVVVIFFRWVGKKLLYGRKTPSKGGQK